jgi:hypothetical protein
MELPPSDSISAATASIIEFSSLPTHLQALILAQAHAPLLTCKASAAILQHADLLAVWVASAPSPDKMLGGAARHKRWDVYSVLLDTVGSQQLLSHSLRHTLLHTAGDGQLQLVQKLLALSPDGTFRGLSIWLPAVENALVAAARAGHVDVCSLMVAHKQHPAFVHRAFFEAVKAGHLAVVKLTVEVDPDVRCYSSALVAAAAGGSLEVFQYLLDLGASIVHSCGSKVSNTACYETCLQAAAAGGNAEIVRVVLEAGGWTSDQKEEAVRRAAAGGHFEALQLLLSERGSL